MLFPFSVLCEILFRKSDMLCAALPLSFAGGRRLRAYSSSESTLDSITAKKRSSRSDLNAFLLVEAGGFGPPKLTQQIYSLPPLATRERFLI